MVTGLARIAAGAGCVALLRPPFEGQPGHLCRSDGPGDGVGGYGELVVEKGSLIHGFVLREQAIGAESVGVVEGGLSFLGGEFLVLALDMIAESEDENTPGEPC